MRIMYSIAPSKTCWHSTTNNGDAGPQRRDKLLALERIYVRSLGVYIWSFIVGRFKIIWCFK